MRGGSGVGVENLNEKDQVGNRVDYGERPKGSVARKDQPHQ